MQINLGKPFSWTSQDVLREVTRWGLLYFLLTTAFSLWNYQEKFVLDGYAHIFFITNFKAFVSPAQREIMTIQQVLPVLLANFDASIKTVMLSYVFSVYALYTIGFLVIILWFKDAPSAIFYLLVHYKGMPYYYFMVVEELLPGVCVAIIFLSAVRNFHVFKNRYLGFSFLFALFLLVVRSHPIAMVSLGLSMPLLWFTHRHFFMKEWKLVVVGVVLGLIAVASKVFMLNNYDSSTINAMKSYSYSVSQLFNVGYFLHLLFIILYAHPFFMLLLGSVLLLLYFRKEYQNAGMVVLLMVLGLSVFNMAVTPDSMRNVDFTSMVFDIRSIQIRVVGFAAFAYYFLPAINLYVFYEWFKGAILFLFAIGIIQIYTSKKASKEYLEQAHKIIERCREKGVRKAIISINELVGGVPVHHNCYQDIMVISSLDDAKATIQAVYVDNNAKPNVAQLSADSLLLDLGLAPNHMSELNEKLYNLPEEPYTLVHIHNNLINNGNPKPESEP
jgi:hypothetical protein